MNGQPDLGLHGDVLEGLGVDHGYDCEVGARSALAPLPFGLKLTLLLSGGGVPSAPVPLPPLLRLSLITPQPVIMITTIFTGMPVAFWCGQMVVLRIQASRCSHILVRASFLLLVIH